MTETQSSVSQWCEQHYPGETPLQALKNLAEELGEIAVELGEDPSVLAQVLTRSADRGGRKGTRDAIEGEIADLQISLWHLGTKIGVDVQRATETKMSETLRPRSVEESAERESRKTAFGLG